MAAATAHGSDIAWLSRDSCLAHCERRRDAMRKDEEALELARDELIRAQKEAVAKGLCKLNKDVKKLTVKEFNATFGVDVVDLIRKQMAAGDVDLGAAGAGKKRPATATATTAMSGGLSMKTPAAHRMGRPPMTTSRTVRKGERVICTSINGSPVDQFEPGEVMVTAKKLRCAGGGGRGRAANAAAAFPISIGIGAGNGETIDLSDPNQRKNLDGAQKKQAMQQLMAIQEQMNQLMADF
ncbi:hypothetical protein ACHAXT_007019 [Thalassiosira profunda]